MATDLSTPSNTTAKMRWEEPYVSDGLNKKFNGLVPAGVVRGGLLVTSGIAMNVTIQDDPVTGDSVYSFINSNGQQVTFRQQGNVTLDLTALASTYVYIGLEITYAVSSATVVKWRAFSLAEVQADPTLVILGAVDVPASGIIPASDIYDDRRSTAWKNVSQYMRGARQVCENGAFELVGRSVTGAKDNPCPGWDWSNISFNNVTYSFTNLNSPQVGDTHFQLSLSGGASAAFAILHKNITPCRGGETVTVRFWIKGDSLAPGPGSGGHMGIRFEASDEIPSNIIQTEYIEDLTLSGTFAYTEIERTFRLDNDARWFGFAIYYDDDNQNSTGDIYFDFIRVWVEQPQISNGQIENYGGLNQGDIIARGLGVAQPWNGASSIEEFVQNILTLRSDDIGSDGYKFARGDATLEFVLNLINGGLDINNFLTLGSNKVGSDVDAEAPRIASTFRDGTYTLLWELENSNVTRSNLRLYATASSYPAGGSDSFVIVSNASYDSATSTWGRDQTDDAWRLDIGSRVAISLRPSTESDNWTDDAWVGSGGYKPFEARLFGSSYVNLRNLVDLGADIKSTTTDRAEPRLEIDLDGTLANSYTCLMKLDSTTGTDDVYLYGVYDADSSPLTTSTEFCIVTNAVWDGTQWSRPDSGKPSLKYSFGPRGIYVYSRGTSDSATWTDSNWEDLNGNASIQAFVGGARDTSYVSLKLADGKIYLGNNRPTAYTNPDHAAAVEVNSLYSKNIVKAWAYFTTTGVSGTGITYDIKDGFNVDSITSSSDTIRVNFVNAFDSRDKHCAIGASNQIAYVDVSNAASGAYAELTAIHYSTGIIDPRTNALVMHWNVIVLGTYD